MRVLFVVSPGHGHLYPMVPLARALTGAGHQVRLATSRSFCATVREADLHPVPAGMDWLESDMERFFPQFAGLEPVLRGYALGRIFDYFVPRSLVPDLQAIVAGWRPDVIANEPGAIAAGMVAELRGVPFATVGGNLPVPPLESTLPDDEETLVGLHDALRGPRSRGRLRRELGLPDREPEPWLYLDLMPPSLHLLTARHLRRCAHPLRPVPYNSRRGGDAALAWLDALPRDRPTIHVSLGTVFHRAPDVLRAVLAGLAVIPSNLVVAVGDVAAADLGPVPAHARLEPWVPHDRLLPRCDLFVMHGGSGGIAKSLGYGVPLLILPQGGNQFVDALRVQSTGAGRFLAPADVTPAAVEREARRLLDEPVHRLSARRLQREIEEMPPMAHGVALMERLAEERQPLVAGEPVPLL